MYTIDFEQYLQIHDIIFLTMELNWNKIIIKIKKKKKKKISS